MLADSRVAELATFVIATFVDAWMEVIYPHESGASDTMGVRARPDHGGGGGFGTKLLQLATFQYISIPKCKLYC